MVPGLGVGGFVRIPGTLNRILEYDLDDSFSTRFRWGSTRGFPGGLPRPQRIDASVAASLYYRVRKRVGNPERR